MKVLLSHKKLILQPVHCTGYLYQTHGNYRLENNELLLGSFIKYIGDSHNISADLLWSFSTSETISIPERILAGTIEALKIDPRIIHKKFMTP